MSGIYWATAKVAQMEINMNELIQLICLEANYQQDVRREYRLWLRRTSAKPFTPPTREAFWVNWNRAW